MSIVKPDYTKPKFNITIEVFQSCIRYNVISTDGEGIEYQEIIGALEIAKTMYIHQTSAKNRRVASRQLKSKE